MKKQQVNCPYCGAPAICRPASMVHGKNTWQKGTHLYVCTRWPDCDSYVTAHKNTLLPMGSLANRDLRNKRIHAHHAFDQLWKSGRMTKKEAYRWLQMQFGLPRENAHIGMFGDYLCERLIRECTETAERMNIAI